MMAKFTKKQIASQRRFAAQAKKGVGAVGRRAKATGGGKASSGKLPAFLKKGK